MSTDEFFQVPKEQSKVKSTIVAKYFSAWARVIIPFAKMGSRKIGYIDLFCGPGQYEDGTKSTPVIIIETALQNPDMREMLVAIFNDKDQQNIESLKKVLGAIPDIDSLKHKIGINNHEVGEKLTETFGKIRMIPSLVFVDPWGYKGLSLSLVHSLTKDWGCDCIFFFNYNRINAGLDNEKFKENMDAIFGAERAAQLRGKLDVLNADERESAVIEEILQAMKDIGCKYVLPFRFKGETGERTSHHLILATKHFKGYDIMKEIMAKESSEVNQGVPSFEYNPATERQPFLFGFVRPLKDLEGMLLNDLRNRRLTVKALYEEHSVGKPYLIRNYKDVIKILEKKGLVTADPPADKRQKRKGEVTLAGNVIVSFPAKV